MFTVLLFLFKAQDESDLSNPESLVSQKLSLVKILPKL